MSPFPLAFSNQTQTHSFPRRSIGAKVSQGLITIVIVLFLATLLFVFLRRSAKKQALERKVLKLAHLRGTGTDSRTDGEGQVRGSEDTLVECDGSVPVYRAGGRTELVGMGRLPVPVPVPMAVAVARPTEYMRESDEEASPPAYESRLDGRSAGGFMEAAYLPNRQ